MGELVFVGLGLGDRGISLAGVRAIEAADLAYLERYTSPPSPTLITELEKATGKKITLVGREWVEDGRKILDQASTSRVAFAVQGDPMIATTHNDLRVRALARGIRTSVIHGATIPAAAASESGLHYYKFGGTITFTRESSSHHQDVYQRIHGNLLGGQHTLLLLEYDVEKSDGVKPEFVFERLLDAEKNFKRGVLSDGTFAIVLGRVGMGDQEIHGGAIGALQSVRFGPPPHCVIIPGRLHFTEEETDSVLKGLVHEANTARPKPDPLLPCPRCGKPMGKVRHNAARLIALDRCDAHGLWLDTKELKQAQVAAQALKLVLSKRVEA